MTEPTAKGRTTGAGGETDAAGAGPEVYRLAQAHRAAEARAALRRVLGVAATRLRRSRVGGSHAVYLATLADGRRCAARFATHPEHDLARELWATERCQAAGVPAPRLLAADLAPESGGAPFAVHERLPGRPGARVALRPVERRAVLEQLGRLAARIHSVRVPGVGELAPLGARGGQGPGGEPAPYGYGGTSVSWWEHASGAFEGHLRNLPPGALPSELASAVRRRFEEGRPVLEAAVPPGSPDSALVHADFRLENTLLVRDPSGGVRVSAVLDFEMALAGDGAFDLAYLAYQDGRDEDDLAAILRGYGLPSGPPSEQPPGQAETKWAGQPPGGPAGIPATVAGLRRRLLLYQVPQALEHLWWVVSFRDETATAWVLARLRALVDALQPHPTSV